jgi:hypothetical protein
MGYSIEKLVLDHEFVVEDEREAMYVLSTVTLIIV